MQSRELGRQSRVFLHGSGGRWEQSFGPLSDLSFSAACSSSAAVFVLLVFPLQLFFLPHPDVGLKHSNCDRNFKVYFCCLNEDLKCIWYVCPSLSPKPKSLFTSCRVHEHLLTPSSALTLRHQPMSRASWNQDSVQQCSSFSLESSDKHQHSWVMLAPPTLFDGRCSGSDWNSDAAEAAALSSGQLGFLSLEPMNTNTVELYQRSAPVCRRVSAGRQDIRCL